MPEGSYSIFLYEASSLLFFKSFTLLFCALIFAVTPGQCWNTSPGGFSICFSTCTCVTLVILLTRTSKIREKCMCFEVLYSFSFSKPSSESNQAKCQCWLCVLTKQLNWLDPLTILHSVNKNRMLFRCSWIEHQRIPPCVKLQVRKVFPMHFHNALWGSQVLFTTRLTLATSHVSLVRENYQGTLSPQSVHMSSGERMYILHVHFSSVHSKGSSVIPWAQWNAIVFHHCTTTDLEAVAVAVDARLFDRQH